MTGVTRTPLNTGGELRCSERVSSSSSTSGTSRVNLVTNPVISREWGKDWEVYMKYISQMIRYSRACGSYQDFLDIGLLLTRKLLNQGFLLVKLKSSLRKFYGQPYIKEILIGTTSSGISYHLRDILHIGVPWNEKFETLTLGGQTRIWYAENGYIVVFPPNYVGISKQSNHFQRVHEC
jgi:hypothetical protein